MKSRKYLPTVCMPGISAKYAIGMAFALALPSPAVLAASSVACAPLPLWQSTVSYPAGRQVQDQGIAYQTNWWTRGQIPANNAGEGKVWQVLGQCAANNGNQSPIAAFTSSAQWLTVQLDATASSDVDGTIDKWEWDFGDGSKGSGVQTSHRYAKSGMYPLTLTVTDRQGATSSKSQSVIASTVMRDPVSGKYTMRADDVQSSELAQTGAPIYALLKAGMATRSNEVADAVAPGSVANPENVKRLERLLPPNLWNDFFPSRHAAYTYQGFLQAAAKFAGFCRSYADGRDSDAICRKSLATMFAHFAQETGGHSSNSTLPQWKQGLMALSEGHCSDTTQDTFCKAFCVADSLWPCGKDAQGRVKNYYGRGAKQLTYNFNYGQFSLAMFDDHRVLLDAPERVAQSWLNLASAMFFFVNTASPYPSILNIVDGSWQPNAADRAAGIVSGFGATINVINDIECGKGQDVLGAVNRIAYYRQFAAALNVPVSTDEGLSCAQQKNFQTVRGGSASLPMYWKADLSYQAAMPEGKSFACKLQSDTTHFKALRAGDYQRCVQAHFDLQIKP